MPRTPSPFRISAIACLALLSAGCQGEPLVPVLTAVRGDGIKQIQSASGLVVTYAHAAIFVKLVPKVAGAPLPAFTTVDITCQAAAPNLPPWSVTLAARAFDAENRSQRPAISQIPQRDDLGVRVFLRNAEGQLVGSGTLDSVAVKVGFNDLSVPIEAIVAGEAEPLLLGASDGLRVDDGVVIKEATLDLTTGFNVVMPGVAEVLIEINGQAYAGGGETALIERLPPEALARWTWRPELAMGTYDPTKLVALDEATPFTLTFKAVDKSGKVLSTRTIALKLEGTATVEVGFDG